MGIASLLLGEQNPFAQWASQNSGMLGAFGAGIASGPDLATGLATGLQYMPAAKQNDLLRAEKQKAEALQVSQTNATKEWLAQNRPDLLPALDMGIAPAKLYEMAIQPQGGDQSAFDERYAAGQQYGLTGDDLNTFALTGSVPGTSRANVTYGTTPVWGKDPATGEMGYGVTGSDGTFKRVDTGGMEVLNPYDLNATKAAGTAFGTGTGTAQFDVPSAELTTNQTIEAINAVRAEKKGMDEQFGNIMGFPQQWTPATPGSEKAKFQVAVDRATNLAFMQAREMLRGGGQITDFESRKAETAITNMQAAMEKGDKAQFEQALNLFEQAVKDGNAKLRTQAGAIPGYGGGAPAQSAPANDIDGILSGLGI